MNLMCNLINLSKLYVIIINEILVFAVDKSLFVFICFWENYIVKYRTANCMSKNCDTSKMGFSINKSCSKLNMI